MKETEDTKKALQLFLPNDLVCAVEEQGKGGRDSADCHM